MSFIDQQFPTDISYGSSGGPSWKTEIVPVMSGVEYRNQRWSKTRYKFDVSMGVRTASQMSDLLSFFHEMRGAFHSFRYKDWNDYTVTDEALVITGGPTCQLSKTYGAGDDEA